MRPNKINRLLRQSKKANKCRMRIINTKLLSILSTEPEMAFFWKIISNNLIKTWSTLLRLHEKYRRTRSIFSFFQNWLHQLQSARWKSGFSGIHYIVHIVFALKAIAYKAFLQTPILKQLFQVFCLPKTYRKDVLPPSMFKNKKKSWINNEIDKIFCNNFASIQVATFCNANMSISVGTQYILQKFKITFLQE